LKGYSLANLPKAVRTFAVHFPDNVKNIALHFYQGQNLANSPKTAGNVFANFPQKLKAIAVPFTKNAHTDVVICIYPNSKALPTY